VKKSSNESATSSIYDDIDRLYQSKLARLTLGMSPAGMVEVYTAWMAQLSMSPGRLTELATFPAHRLQDALDRIGKEGLSCASDPRFRSEQWCQWPWRFYAEYFRFQEEFSELATQNISGLSPSYERAASFAARQVLDMFSPHNFIVTNPELAQKTLETGGMNLVQGAQNAAEDWRWAWRILQSASKWRPPKAKWFSETS